MTYYDKPTASDPGVYLTSAEILIKINSGIKETLSKQKIGKIMKRLGYSVSKIKGYNKYHVRELQLIDIQENRKREVAELDSRPF